MCCMISSFLNQKNIKWLSVNDVMIISYILWPSIVKLSFNIRPKNCCNKFITLKSVSSLMDDPLSNLCRDIGRSDDVPAVNRGLLDQLQKHGPRVLKMFEKNVPKMFEKLFDNNFLSHLRGLKSWGVAQWCAMKISNWIFRKWSTMQFQINFRKSKKMCHGIEIFEIQIPSQFLNKFKKWLLFEL